MLRHSLLSMMASLLVGGLAGLADADELERVTQTLVAPPFLPAHEQRATGPPKLIQVRLVIEEKILAVAPGASIWALTFNGSVPGPIIVVHENDSVIWSGTAAPSRTRRPRILRRGSFRAAPPRPCSTPSSSRASMPTSTTT